MNLSGQALTSSLSWLLSDAANPLILLLYYVTGVIKILALSITTVEPALIHAYPHKFEER